MRLDLSQHGSVADRAGASSMALPIRREGATGPSHLGTQPAGSRIEGDLQPRRQADVERAMHDWLSLNTYEAGETQVRARAKAVWEAIKP